MYVHVYILSTGISKALYFWDEPLFECLQDSVSCCHFQSTVCTVKVSHKHASHISHRYLSDLHLLTFALSWSGWFRFYIIIQ